MGHTKIKMVLNRLVCNTILSKPTSILGNLPFKLTQKASLLGNLSLNADHITSERPSDVFLMTRFLSVNILFSRSMTEHRRTHCCDGKRKHGRHDQNKNRNNKGRL